MRLVCLIACIILGLVCASAVAVAATTGSHNQALLKHGRYLVMIGGCNDCHTPGFADHGGKAPDKDWLIGSRLGFRGPWGTTYPPNLRLFMQTMTRKQWIRFAHTVKLRPPMPYYALHTMTDHDLSAIYAFMRHLGPAGKPAPQFVPPGQTPPEPYVSWHTKSAD